MRTSSTPFSLSPASQSLPVEVLGWTSQPEYLSELMNWIPQHHHPVAIPTRIQGPMPPGTIRLILGRSGLTLKGLQILPGLTDPDYSGEIKVMALSHSFHVIPQGQGIAHSLLLPCHAPNNSNPVTRGEQGLGITDDQVVCFTQQILSDGPHL